MEIFTPSVIWIQDNINDLIRIEHANISILGNVYSTECWNLQNFIKDMPYKWILSKVCKNNKEAIGYLFSSSYCEDFAHINRLAIHPNHIKSGIGKLIINSFLESSKENNIFIISLIVNCNNQNAINFYLKNDFYKINRFEMSKFIERKQIKHFQGDIIYDGLGNKYFVFYRNLN